MAPRWCGSKLRSYSAGSGVRGSHRPVVASKRPIASRSALRAPVARPNWPAS
jgi:hypothetical protein